MDEQRIEHAISAAGLIFWRKVGEHFPEAVSGDLPPDISQDLATCQNRAVHAWVRLNIPAEAQREPVLDYAGEEPPLRILYRAVPESAFTCRVEGTGPNGELYTVSFSGPDAEARAFEYAEFKNRP